MLSLSTFVATGVLRTSRGAEQEQGGGTGSEQEFIRHHRKQGIDTGSRGAPAAGNGTDALGGGGAGSTATL
jgi:hypothetical protein